MRTNLIQGTTYMGINIDEHGNLAEGFTIHESLGTDANAELKALYDGLKEKGQWKPRVVVHDLNTKVEIETVLLIPVTFRLQNEQRDLIDYKRSTFDVPDRYDVFFDEIVVTGYAKSTKN